jgi:ribosome-binding factor A
MTERGTGRMRRVDEAVKQVLSEAIPELKDPGLGFVTVTGVRTTKDLAQATVWVSVLGSERKQAATLAALERAGGVLQGRIARQLHLRRTPQLSFAYDQAVERGVRMTQLIDELARDLPDDPESPESRRSDERS